MSGSESPPRSWHSEASNPFALPRYWESHRRQVVLAVCCVSVLLVGTDMTAANVALPSIGHDFDTAASGLSWIIDAYTLVLATLLMLSASMADRFGRKLVFRIGLLTLAGRTRLQRSAHRPADTPARDRQRVLGATQRPAPCQVRLPTPLLIAGIALTCAAVILTQSSITTPIAWLLIAYALMGLGNSSVGAPITHIAVAGMPPDQAGVAAGVSSTTRQIGQTIGVSAPSTIPPCSSSA